VLHLDEAKALRDEVAFMQAVKVLLTKRDVSKKKLDDAAKDAAVRQIINQAVVSEQVVDIFLLSVWTSPTLAAGR
jgi:type I restriction enzyme R subunit